MADWFSQRSYGRLVSGGKLKPNSHIPCRAHAVFLPCRAALIHTCHAMPMPRCAVAVRSHFQNGMVVARHGRGVVCLNQTRPHYVNQMGKKQSKPLAARHGRGTAWARHGNGIVCVNLL
jgi:hypothetical protein